MKKEPSPDNPYPYCLCGCGAENNPGARFNQYHDGPLTSILTQVKSGKLGADAIPKEVIEAARNDPNFKVVGYTAEEILSLAGEMAAAENWGMRRGEIWWAYLPEISGSGASHLGLVLIIQDNQINSSRINTAIVAVVTSNLSLDETDGKFFLDIGNPGLSKDSVVNVPQILTIDKSFFTNRVGALPPETMTAVDGGLRLALGL